jgi:peroxiredoxin
MRIMILALWLLAGVTVADSPRGVSPLRVGAEVPALTLHTAKGEDIDLNLLIARKALVLAFYRGGWCPYCKQQLGQMQDMEAELSALGFRIVAVSADRPAKLRKTIDKLGLNYTVLSDSDMKAARAFGIAYRVDSDALKRYEDLGIDLEDASGEKHGLLPVPSIFLIGTDGVIRFVYTNRDHGVRFEPKLLLDAARNAAKGFR